MIQGATTSVPVRKIFRRALLAGIAVALAMPSHAAPPVLYKDPLRSSPVRAVPDELMIIAGSGLSATDTVVYLKLTDTTTPLTPPGAIPFLSTATTGRAVIVASSEAPHAVTVRLPAVMLTDTSYAFWVANSEEEWSDGFKTNDARPMWISPEIAYRNAGVGTIGRQFKVVGRNLQPAPGKTTKVILAGPTTYTLTAANDGNSATAIEHYVAKVTLPANMPIGTYTVKVMRDGVSTVTLAGQTLVVRADPPTPAAFNVGSYGCSPNDTNDDTACIVAAIQAASPTGGRVSFAAGTWIVGAGDVSNPAPDTDNGIVVPEGVSLVGAGQLATTVRRGTAWRGPSGEWPAVFTLQGRNVISDATWEDMENYRSSELILTPYFSLGKLPTTAGPHDPTTIDEVTFLRNTFARPSIAIGNFGFPIRHLVITGNEFGAFQTGLFPGGNRYLTNIKYRIDDSVIVGNTFMPGDYYDPAIRQGTIASQIGAGYHVDFSDNIADGLSTKYITDLDHRGWRAAFFWHMMNNHEHLLVSRNTGTCTGDKAGDGEMIDYDGNANTFALANAPTPTDVTPTTLTVPGPLFVTTPNDFYSQHWIQIVDGKGLAQSRKIVSYTDPTLANVTFTVSPAWEVPPDSTSRVAVSRQYWQVYTVDNTVDIRPCQKSNATEPASGEIDVWGTMADSTFDHNKQYDSDGLMVLSAHGVDSTPGPIVESDFRTKYFIELRENRVEGEYDFDDPCSDSGIKFPYGMPPGNTPVVQQFGINVVKNTVIHADGPRGGGISIITSWYFPTDPLVRGTIIQRNTIQDIQGGPQFSPCMNHVVTRDGINLWPGAWGTVLFRNTITNVTNPIVDGGTGTVTVP